MSNAPAEEEKHAGQQEETQAKKERERERKRNKAWCELVIYYHAISVMKFSNNFSVQSRRALRKP